MNAIGEVFGKILSHPQEDVNPQMPEDYIGEDGLLYCGVCHEKKQTRIKIFDKEMVVPVVCKCRQEELELEQKRRKEQEQMQAIESLRRMSLMSDNFKSATFENYIHRPENERACKLAKIYVERFNEMYEKGRGILFYGPVGTGKSYTSACIANALLDKGIPVLMTSFVKILQVLQPGKEDEGSLISKMENAKLLIIDDLGAERSTEYAQEKVYNIIDSRVRSKKPMILTTNLTIDEMTNVQDIRYDRIYDRIREKSFVVQIKGTSFRQDKGIEILSEMRELLEDDDG